MAVRPLCIKSEITGLLHFCKGCCGGQQFLGEIRGDDLTLYSAETAVVTFSDEAECIADFDTADRMQVPELRASGLTDMGDGLTMALDLMETRKNQYKTTGVDYYQPILVVMSDGNPNGDPQTLDVAIERIRALMQRMAARPVTKLGPQLTIEAR